MASCVTPEPQEIRAELERILASPSFAGAHRSQQLLRYVVENSLADRDAALKEYTIAIEVFGRDASYDPSIDATVRVEASRLRSRLRDYYIANGQSDVLIIEIPKGGYRAVFSERPRPAETYPAATSGPGQTAALLEKAHSGQVNKDSRRLRTLMWGLAAVFAVAAVFGWIAIRDNGRRIAASSQADEAIRFAVLPFSNETGDVGKNYFTDGLTDNLIRQLSELTRLHVMSRSAVDRVKPADAAHELGVAMVLAGNLRRNPDGQLVLNSELSNVKDGTIISSRQYLANESDIPSLQADVVRDVIQALGIDLDARESAKALRPPTANAGAYQAFLQGESAARDRSPEGLHAAIRDYEEAIRQDPRFAMAYSSLAESHAMLGLYYEPAREHMPLAREYAEHALILDPSIGQAHGTLGLVDMVYDWNIHDAENELASAETRLSAIHVLSCASHLYHLMGSDNTRHAEEDLRRLLEFDPHSGTLIGELGCVSYYGRRYADSIRYYREAIATEPHAAFLYWGAGRSLAMEGRYREALEMLRQFKSMNGSEPPIITAEIGYSEGASGDRSSALATVKQLKELSAHTYVDPYFIALVYHGMKDDDHTYQWLDRAYEAKSPFMISIATDPKWAPLQGEARFQEIWNRMMESGHSASATPAGVISAIDKVPTDVANPERR